MGSSAPTRAAGSLEPARSRRGAPSHARGGLERGHLLLLAPYGLGLAILLLLPMLLSVPMAFAAYDGLGAPRWAGLENFAQLADDRVIGISVTATLGLAALAAPLRGLVALGLALLLRSPARGRGLLRYSAFVPSVIPEAAYALLWLYIFNPLWGPLNWLLPFAGYRTDAWLLEPGPARLAITAMLLWTVGEGVALLLAARRALPPELYEAATLDGAGPAAAFRYITLPLLLPFQALLLCRDVIVTIGASFTAAIIVTRGGPYYATSYLPYWAYLNGTDFGRFGYAAAINLLLFGLSLAILAALALLSRRWWRLSDIA